MLNILCFHIENLKYFVIKFKGGSCSWGLGKKEGKSRLVFINGYALSSCFYQIDRGVLLEPQSKNVFILINIMKM